MNTDKQEPAISPENLPPQPESAAETPQPAFAKPEKPSIGEKRWWWANYIGVGYLTNLAVSIVLWDFLMSGRGRPAFDAAQRGAESLLKGAGMSNAAAESTAAIGTKMACSPLGGHFTVIGNAYLEAHSGRITHNFNKKLDPDYKYKDLEIPADAKDDEYPPLAKPPNHNTPRQIAMRRGLGWIGVVSSGLLLNKIGLETPLENGTLRIITQGIEKSGIAPLQRLARTPRFQRYTKLAALDMYFTAVTTAIIALTKNTFGKSRDASANAEPELGSEEALSLDIPGLTDDDQPQRSRGRLNNDFKSNAPRNSVTPSYISGQQPLSNPMIPKENLMGSVQKSDTPASEMQFSRPT